MFGFDQMHAGYDVEACHRAGRSREFLDALWRRSRLAWRDLLIADHEKNGFEPVPQSLLAGAEIAGMTPDQKLLVLRFAGANARIIGYREGRIYHLLWVDNDLSLYRH